MRAFFLPLLLSAVLASGCLVKKSTHQRALDQIKTLEGQLADANGKITDQDNRITTLGDELSKLKGDLDTTEDARRKKEEEVRKVLGEKEATEAELVELRRQRDIAEKRLSAYRDLQKRFQALVDAGTLQVAFRNGQMTLKLPSGVLFPSGSADLSKAGQETLAKVAEALISFKDRRFLVAGHTDSVPIKTRKFKNNWYLSTARAVSVVEFLGLAGFPDSQLAAAGYADKDPVGDNATEEGRELNRRIEIILVPDLSELPQLAEEPK
ncbi:MAG: OmpA family protein [Kofleriaceae bacterium]|nr:OmpA family protein [Myxococcales bacterium]MCB9573468.1 OmpA family protein [Kofleriaceae bacterium]